MVNLVLEAGAVAAYLETLALAARNVGMSGFAGSDRPWLLLASSQACVCGWSGMLHAYDSSTTLCKVGQKLRCMRRM